MNTEHRRQWTPRWYVLAKRKKKDQIVAVVEYLECLVSSRQNIWIRQKKNWQPLLIPVHIKKVPSGLSEC